MDKIEKDDLRGCVATYNADPFCVEDDYTLDEVWAFVNHGFHPIVDAYDYEVACAQLDLNEADANEIYETDDYMVKFCLL